MEAYVALGLWTGRRDADSVRQVYGFELYNYETQIGLFVEGEDHRVSEIRLTLHEAARLGEKLLALNAEKR